jgi:hypothetical protein
MSRYTQREQRLNNPRSGNSMEIYQEIIDNRNIKQIIQYTSPAFPPLTSERRQSVQYDSHIWSRGDRFYKIAYEYYGDSSLWYLIAWFNQAPTESHINLGDTIMVPISSERVMTYFNR